MINTKKITALLLASMVVLTSCGSETPEVESSQQESLSEASSEANSSQETTEDNSSQEAPEDTGLTEEEIAAISSEIIGLYKGTIIPEDAVEVVMSTTLGDISLRLFPTEAPKAVENFVTHAKNGYYDGVSFHRVINDFMIQGGDPLGNGTGGESIWGEGFETEFTGKLFHFNGAISMANTGAPNSNGSQFFIVNGNQTGDDLLDQAKSIGLPWVPGAIEMYEENNGTLHLDGAHPVFGYVTGGMDVVEAISQVATNESAVPVDPVVIISITVE